MQNHCIHIINSSVSASLYATVESLSFFPTFSHCFIQTRVMRVQSVTPYGLVNYQPGI